MKIKRDIDFIDNDNKEYTQVLEQAQNAYAMNKSWPSSAWRLYVNIRKRFPNDNQVLRLGESLSRYNYLRKLLYLGLGVTVIVLGYFLFTQAYDAYENYVLSKIPTPTPTLTATPTSTSTSTPTLTPTITPTLTPTPTIAVSIRSIWARSGCYEQFEATGKSQKMDSYAFYQNKLDLITLTESVFWWNM